MKESSRLPLDYRLLQALDAVVQEQNFERAARALCLTQSAVSQRIKQLEQQMAQPLLIRATPLQPTAAGRQLLSPRQIGLSLRQQGLGLPQLRLGAVQRDLEWSGIDLEEQLPTLDQPAFRHADPDDRAADLGAQLDGIGRSEVSGEFRSRCDFPHDDLGDGNGGRSRRGGSAPAPGREPGPSTAG